MKICQCADLGHAYPGEETQPEKTLLKCGGSVNGFGHCWSHCVSLLEGILVGGMMSVKETRSANSQSEKSRNVKK